MSIGNYRSTQPNASPGAGAGSRTGQSISTRKATTLATSQGASTRRSLRIWRAVTVLICLLAGIGSFVAVAFTDASVKNIDTASEQILRLEQAKADVLNAQATLATALAFDPQRPGEEYLKLLGEGAKKMAKAAEVADRDQAEFVNRAIEQTPKYASQLGAATQLMPADRDAALQRFAAANKLLQEGVVAELDAITGNTGLVWLDREQNVWLTLVLLVPIVLLIAASVDHARRTRRLLNIGLVIALGCMVGTMYVVGQALTGTSYMVDQSRSGPQSEVRLSAKAVSEAAAARNAQSLVIMGAMPAEEGWQRVDQSLEHLKETGKVVADVEFVKAVEKFASINQQVRSGVDVDHMEVRDANRLLDKAARDVADQKLNAMSRYASEQRGKNLTAELLGLVLPMLAAIAAGFGLSQPLRRYR